jgi:hypothetical protein
MALKASEISQLIKERIDKFESSAEARELAPLSVSPTESYASTALPTHATVRCSNSPVILSAWR